MKGPPRNFHIKCRYCSLRYRNFIVSLKGGVSGFCCSRMLKNHPTKGKGHESNEYVFCILTKNPKTINRFETTLGDIAAVNTILSSLIFDVQYDKDHKIGAFS